MKDEIADDKAWICTDCLIIHANDDWSGISEEDAAEIRAGIERELAGFRLTVGWGREQHECASNFSVWPIESGGGKIASISEFRADTFAEAIEQAEMMAVVRAPDFAGWKILAHDLETEGDRGQDCECETESFGTRTCDSCGRHFGGEWHGATIWRILPDPERVSALIDRSLSGYLTVSESAELKAEARRKGF